VGFQLPYLAAKTMLGTFPFPDYFDQLVDKWHQFGHLVWFREVGTLGLIFWKVEGPLFTLGVFLAWIFLLIRVVREKSFQDLTILALSVIPFVYFSLFKWEGETLPRTVSSLQPIVSIAMARVLGEFPAKVRIFFTPVFVGIVLLSAFPRNLKAGITRSGYADASRYLQSLGNPKPMILRMEPAWRFYLGKGGYELYEKPPSVEAALKRAREKNLKYVLIDNTALYSKEGKNFRDSLFKLEIEPVARFSHPRGRSFQYLLDEHGIEKYPLVAEDPWSGEILVFKMKDIKDSLAKPPSYGRP
jgi:hypothetical protein